MEKGLRYLARTQREDGSWIPLWFGNQHAPDEINPVYGTARVLLALEELDAKTFPVLETVLFRAGHFLAKSQHEDGGWGVPGSGPSSVEETALAIEALAGVTEITLTQKIAREAVMKGANWLIEKVESGEWRQPSPIGFYFAKLWYYERLYPQVFTVAALGRVGRISTFG